MADNDNGTTSLHEIFSAIDDALTAMWNYPINWEWLGYVVLAVWVVILGGFILAQLWQALRWLYSARSDLVEITWSRIRHRMRRGH